MTNAELAAFIESHLLEKGIYVVLSGGACVSIYSSNKYVSMDLDLVNARFAKRRDIRSAIQEIGFQEEGHQNQNHRAFRNIDFRRGTQVPEKPRISFQRKHLAPPKVGRNQPCPCGSGKKYKVCCGKKKAPQERP